ncbi:PE-PGRS family protein [Gigaspora margarita]|uniref:PE-PGRS family protein n=1 Tax=Gigaspora margarita TaxID=4874 RepID=A0A8H3XNA7_GIGMA|nr:PE-PGRS family protein [Gigaspora margarita]
MLPSQTYVQCCSEDKICGEDGKERCSSDETCVNGKCVCFNGLTSCNGNCIDTTSNARNCGSCGNTCLSEETCVNGKCIDCTVDSDCVSDYLLNNSTGQAIGAAGKCINHVCYVCAGCLPQGYYGTFENTGGGGSPANCLHDIPCPTGQCDCCRPRDAGDYKLVMII